eukprot:CAMPEP_0179962204 /NCGR_PEP_ID=MMETSP0983-20121128/30107_1 /TAXON_ID=483367 /ORGANISM="non described non described, Strain CCMP 2436" /LENGTH=214 /DNA_ID=CAMNT_0021874721 /DNA_START=377 /DNA_END=1020 /DNA_ORIENTATION=+
MPMDEDGVTTRILPGEGEEQGEAVTPEETAPPSAFLNIFTKPVPEPAIVIAKVVASQARPGRDQARARAAAMQQPESFAAATLQLEPAATALAPAEPATEPTTESATKPTTEPATEHAAGLTAKPTAEPDAEGSLAILSAPLLSQLIGAFLRDLSNSGNNCWNFGNNCREFLEGILGITLPGIPGIPVNSQFFGNSGKKYLRSGKMQNPSPPSP